MNNWVYKLYFKHFQIPFFENWVPRLCVRLMNLITPIYFKWTSGLKSNSLPKTVDETKYIVSLTSFPARINKVWLTIETILRQSDKPDKVMLWLYKGEFNGKHSLPKKLQTLEKRGLEIRFCDENLMPHKKYFYTMQEYPEANVITIDDDMIYPYDLVHKLKLFHEKYPTEIICPISREIKITNHQIQPYSDWNYLKYNMEPSLFGLPIGVGSVLYPPNSIHQDVFSKETLLRLSLETDDLWLKIMSLRKNTKVVSLGSEYSRFFIPIIIKRNTNLMDSNIEGGNNDIVFKVLMKEYSIAVSAFKD